MKNFTLLIVLLFCINNSWAQNRIDRKCARPLDDYVFRNALSSFAYQSNRPARNLSIRNFTAANCLNTAQTRRLAALYQDESMRFDYICYAADFVLDFPNYPTMADLIHDYRLKRAFFEYIGYQVPGQSYGNHPYTGRFGAPFFASDQEFNTIYNLVQLESFDQNKTAAFKVAANGRFFRASDLKRIAELYNFDSYRLDFAKEAVAHCYDLDNLYTLSTVFSFDSYRQNYNDFLMDNIDRYVWNGQMGIGQGWQQHGNFPIHQSFVPGYTGRIGFRNPMSNTEFQNLLRMVQNESFDRSRLNILKSAIGGRGFTVNQVTELARCFDYDTQRYDFAVFAYNYTYDIDNYYAVANSFSFDNYKRKLIDYLRTV